MSGFRSEYLDTFLKLDAAQRAAKDAAIEDTKGYPDGIYLLSAFYEYPVHALCQSTSRVLSHHASVLLRHKKFSSEMVEYLALQHTHVQRSIVAGVKFNLPPVFMALVVVNQNDLIDEVHFACSPGGTKPTRKAIREAREHYFPDEIKVLTEDRNCRKSRLMKLKAKKSATRGKQLSDEETEERKRL